MAPRAIPCPLCSAPNRVETGPPTDDPAAAGFLCLRCGTAISITDDGPQVARMPPEAGVNPAAIDFTIRIFEKALAEIAPEPF